MELTNPALSPRCHAWRHGDIRSPFFVYCELETVSRSVPNWLDMENKKTSLGHAPPVAIVATNRPFRHDDGGAGALLRATTTGEL